MFSQLTRYASWLDIQIDDAEMDIRASYDSSGKMLLSDASPGAEWLHANRALPALRDCLAVRWMRRRRRETGFDVVDHRETVAATPHPPHREKAVP